MPNHSSTSTPARSTEFTLKPSLWTDSVKGLIPPEGRPVQTPTGSRVYPFDVPRIEVLHQSSGMGFAVKPHFKLLHQKTSEAPDSSSGMSAGHAGVEIPIIHCQTEQDCQAMTEMIAELRMTMTSQHDERHSQINQHVQACEFHIASRLLSDLVRTVVQSRESKWEADGWDYCETWEPKPNFDSEGEAAAART